MARNLVICCDGTNSQFGDRATNVLRLYQAIERGTEAQRAFYEPGVGTFAPRMLSARVGRFVSKLLGAAFGYGIQDNLVSAYRYLIRMYEPGDRVFFFGFSRGAFTARSLAGLVDTWGILPAEQQDQADAMVSAYLAVEQPSPGNAPFATRSCDPHFVGVWDTVGALGLVLRLRRFHDNDLSPGIAHAVQALAIDEKRRSFRPTLWNPASVVAGQRLQQRWFAGVHSDIGGGYAERGLADLTLRWMLVQARDAGLQLAPGFPDSVHGNALGRLHVSYHGAWRLLGVYQRPVPDDMPLAPSVYTRLSSGIGYNPPNLSTARRDDAKV